MTSRLKRKLENIGVDVQSNSSRLTENFCLIGTPLPPLEKSKDSGEFVPLWKQDVRDEQGRRRLHGAFTGGFSAGYYNTVGSKEGWTPSTFSSSRADRASKKQARPEDFMDEEDLAELRDSKKLVDTTEETDIFGGTEAEIARRRGVGEVEKGSIANALESLLPLSKDSVGARLLKKMGWRLGQGIGPRVTYKQLLAQDGRSIGEGDYIDEEASKHLYAPRDTKTIIFHKKENSFGLGYIPGQGLNEVIQGRNGHATETGPNLSAGFGLGALNETEDDDLDVYDPGLPRESRRMAYDAGEAEDDDNDIIQGDKIRGPSKVPAKTTGTPSAIFRDGRPLVSGFVLFEKPLVENRWFPIPDIPKGWTPDPRRVWAKDISNEQDRIKNTPQTSTAAKDHRPWIKGKTADERGSMLGETPLPSAPRSVFDYLSQKDRERLKNLASGSEPPKPAPPPLISISIPRTDPHIAQAALKGFQPFTTDPQKQLRYTVYLQSQATTSDPQELKPLSGQSNEDFNKEVSDYAKAAQIFKPVSGAMAGRFASASTMEMIGSTNHGLHKPTKEDYARIDGPKEEAEKEETVEESPKAHAARMGMFGPLTRDTKMWQPARLLCRRFGVKDPHPDGVDPSVPNAGEASGGKTQAWQDEILPPAGVPHVTASTTVADGSDTSSTPPTKRSTGKRDLTNIGLGEDDEQGKDTLTYERPTKDIFKAIFASDDEDSDEEETGDVADEPLDERATSAHAQPSSSTAPVAQSSNSQLYPGATFQRPSEEGKVDLATFKPTFIPKSERKKGGDNGGKVKKDREKKKKGKMVVSFDVEDDSGVQEKRPKEKRRKKEKVEEADDESMWVEKPPPEITKGLVIPVTNEPDEEVNRPQRGRKRAVDFL